MLNGGVILTGGGSKLKHLIQLTEYVTGLNARIGFPNEHLSGGHIDELAKPMYSTCIGLILKGYNDYENKNKQMSPAFVRVQMTEQKSEAAIPEEETMEVEDKKLDMKPRRTLKGFMDKMKTDLIGLFAEEEDTKF
jgi:cell division protein FtsA